MVPTTVGLFVCGCVMKGWNLSSSSALPMPITLASYIFTVPTIIIMYIHTLYKLSYN